MSPQINFFLQIVECNLRCTVRLFLIVYLTLCLLGMSSADDKHFGPISDPGEDQGRQNIGLDLNPKYMTL